MRCAQTVGICMTAGCPVPPWCSTITPSVAGNRLSFVPVYSITKNDLRSIGKTVFRELFSPFSKCRARCRNERGGGCRCGRASESKQARKAVPETLRRKGYRRKRSGRRADSPETGNGSSSVSLPGVFGLPSDLADYLTFSYAVIAYSRNFCPRSHSLSESK